MKARALVIIAVLAAILLWKRDAVSEGVQSVYYSATQDTRENEDRWGPVIADAESTFGLPDGLLHRQLQQESHFRTDIIGETPDGVRLDAKDLVVSGAGAVGIAQIVPHWHPTVDPRDPHASIYYAAKIMAGWNRQFGSWQYALMAYNWGPGNLSNWLKKGGVVPDETAKYVAQITADVAVA